MVRNEHLREEGLIIFQSWEALHFLAQAGFSSENTESAYRFVRSERFVRFLKDMGVTQFWTYSFKGYGLEFEKAARQATRALVKTCHRHGIRVIAYVSAGSLTPETLLSSNPEAGDWLLKTADGTPARMLQSFRTKPCYTSRGYLAHIKEAADAALDCGCDGIHFDNLFWSLDSDGCRCERCVRLFRRFLADRYGTATARTRTAGRLRFGRNRFDQARPPFRNTNEELGFLPVANDQEWVLFKTAVLTDFVRELSDHVHARGKLVEFNVLWSPFTNHARCGLDIPEILRHADMVFYEGAPRKPSYNSTGAPLTRIRSFRICEEHGVPMLCHNGDILALAESFAFNPGGLGFTLGLGFDGRSFGGTRPADAIEKIRAFYGFYRKHRRYQTCSETLANVAVLRQATSMALDSNLPYLASGCIEQLLQEAGIPFRIVSSFRPADSGGIDLLILPAVTLMSDAERDAISAAVRERGLALLVLKEAGLLDEYSRRRSRVKEVRTLEDWLDAASAEQAFADLAGRDFSKDFVTKAGRGAVGFVKNMDFVKRPGPRDEQVTSECIACPKNSEAILRTIRRLLVGREWIRVTADADLVVDIRRRQDTGEGVIHLFHVSFLKGKRADARVWFRWPEKVRRVDQIRWDRGRTTLRFAKKDGGHVVQVWNIAELSTLLINPE